MSLSAHVFEILNTLKFVGKEILFNFIHFYFWAKDFSLNIVYSILKLFRNVKNITLEGTVFYLGPSFYFI